MSYLFVKVVSHLLHSDRSVLGKGHSEKRGQAKRYKIELLKAEINNFLLSHFSRLDSTSYQHLTVLFQCPSMEYATVNKKITRGRAVFLRSFPHISLNVGKGNSGHYCYWLLPKANFMSKDRAWLPQPAETLLVWHMHARAAADQQGILHTLHTGGRIPGRQKPIRHYTWWLKWMTVGVGHPSPGIIDINKPTHTLFGWVYLWSAYQNRSYKVLCNEMRKKILC